MCVCVCTCTCMCVCMCMCVRSVGVRGCIDCPSQQRLVGSLLLGAVVVRVHMVKVICARRCFDEGNGGGHRRPPALTQKNTPTCVQEQLGSQEQPSLQISTRGQRWGQKGEGENRGPRARTHTPRARSKQTSKQHYLRLCVVRLGALASQSALVRAAPPGERQCRRRVGRGC